MPLCNCSKQVGLPCSSEMIRWQRKACTFHNVTAGFSFHDSMDSAALCIVYRGLVGWEMGGGFPRDHSATHRKVRNFWERLVYGTAPHCVPLKCVSYLLGAMTMKSGHFEWEMRMTLMQMCLPLNDPIIRRVCDQLWNCWRGWYEFLIKSSNVLRCESNAHPIDVVICLWWVFKKRFR